MSLDEFERFVALQEFDEAICLWLVVRRRQHDGLLPKHTGVAGRDLEGTGSGWQTRVGQLRLRHESDIGVAGRNELQGLRDILAVDGAGPDTLP